MPLFFKPIFSIFITRYFPSISFTKPLFWSSFQSRILLTFNFSARFVYFSCELDHHVIKCENSADLSTGACCGTWMVNPDKFYYSSMSSWYKTIPKHAITRSGVKSTCGASMVRRKGFKWTRITLWYLKASNYAI